MFTRLFSCLFYKLKLGLLLFTMCVCVKVALFYIGMSPKPVVKAYDLEDKLNLKSLRIID